MGKTIVIAIVAVVICMFAVACGTKKEASYEKISQEQAKEMMDSQSDVLILDVRTQSEYSEGHVPGAICIPNETIDESVTSELPDKEQTILVYCRSGNRSRMAAKKLANLGYTQVKDFGGIQNWTYDVEK